MSYTTNGTSFIDSINDRGSEQSRYTNHIMRQGLIQFVALDYVILKQVRILRQQIESINNAYLLGNGNGIGLPMLASLNLNSLFDLQNNQAEIKKLRSLAKILYRIYSQRYDWVIPDYVPQDDRWIDPANSTVVYYDGGRITIVNNRRNRDNTQISVAIDWTNINPKILFIREDPDYFINNSVKSKIEDQISIPLQLKNANNTTYAFTVEIYDDINIVTAYTKFKIAQLLHGIWAYSLLYPTTFYELSPNYKDIIQIENDFPEQTDPRFLIGVEEAKRKTRSLEFLHNLENASSGIPLQDEVKEIIKNIVHRIGNMPMLYSKNPDIYKDISVSDPVYDDYEDNNEINVVDSLLLERPITIPQGQPSRPPPHPNPDADDIIKAVGLEDIFHQLFDLVQDDSAGGFNVEVFNNIRDIWGRLFFVGSGTPDGINYIEKQLPTIEGSFGTIIPSSSQQDLFAPELDNVKDFLRGAIRQKRLGDIRNVLNDPSASKFINTFRSIGGLDPQVMAGNDFWLNYDDDNWFDYLFVIWWVLTYEQKFSEIADFASGRYPPPGVNFDAMFLGGLGGASIVLAGGPNQNIDQSNSSARLELEYATYERNLSSLDNQLGRPGGPMRLSRSYGGLPL